MHWGAKLLSHFCKLITFVKVTSKSSVISSVLFSVPFMVFDKQETRCGIFVNAACCMIVLLEKGHAKILDSQQKFDPSVLPLN